MYGITIHFLKKLTGLSQYGMVPVGAVLLLVWCCAPAGDTSLVLLGVVSLLVCGVLVLLACTLELLLPGGLPAPRLPPGLWFLGCSGSLN